MDIRIVTCKELSAEPGFPDLLQEYAEECALGGLPVTVSEDIYYTMEERGLITLLAAFDDDQLLGFVSVLVTVLPKYSLPVAATESFFVASKHRHTGAGLRLLRAAEKLAVAKGAVGMMVSAPSGSRLAEVAPRSGYEESNRVFFRRFSDA